MRLVYAVLLVGIVAVDLSEAAQSGGKTPVKEQDVANKEQGVANKEQDVANKEQDVANKESEQKDASESASESKKSDQEDSELDIDLAKEDDSMETLVNELQELTNKRLLLKLLIGGYTFAHVTLYASQYLSLVNPMMLIGVQLMKAVKDKSMEPLDEMYEEHQRLYNKVVSEYLQKNPHLIKKNGKLPVKMRIKTKEGKTFEIKVLSPKLHEELPETSLHINNKGAVDLMRTAIQM